MPPDRKVIDKNDKKNWVDLENSDFQNFPLNQSQNQMNLQDEDRKKVKSSLKSEDARDKRDSPGKCEAGKVASRTKKYELLRIECNKDQPVGVKDPDSSEKKVLKSFSKNLKDAQLEQIDKSSNLNANQLNETESNEQTLSVKAHFYIDLESVQKEIHSGPQNSILNNKQPKPSPNPKNRLSILHQSQQFSQV